MRRDLVYESTIPERWCWKIRPIMRIDDCMWNLLHATALLWKSKAVTPAFVTRRHLKSPADCVSKRSGAVLWRAKLCHCQSEILGASSALATQEEGCAHAPRSSHHVWPDWGSPAVDKEEPAPAQCFAFTHSLAQLCLRLVTQPTTYPGRVDPSLGGPCRDEYCRVMTSRAAHLS